MSQTLKRLQPENALHENMNQNVAGPPSRATPINNVEDAMKLPLPLLQTVHDSRTLSVYPLPILSFSSSYHCNKRRGQDTFVQRRGQDTFVQTGSSPLGSRKPSLHVTDMQAKGLPLGWTMQIKERSSGASKGHHDRYYYSPVLRKKFRSRVEVELFLRILNDDADLDEEQAYVVYKEVKNETVG